MSSVTTAAVELPNGETMFYREREGGEIPVVLLHGNASSSTYWDRIFEEMADQFKLYAMDLRGFGNSSYEQSIDSLGDLATDVSLFADAVDLDQFHLWGWSLGAGVAMCVAADIPDQVGRLVLLSPPSTQGLPIYQKDENLEPTETVLTTREELATDPVSVAPVMQAIQQRDKETIKELWQQAIFGSETPPEERFDAYAQGTLKQRNLLDANYALVHFNISEADNGIEPGTGEVTDIDAKTLVLRGEDDLVVTRAMSERVVDDITHARFVELTDCGHAAMIEDLDQVRATVEPFLDTSVD